MSRDSPYTWEEYLENFKYYQKGGFHPVKIGEEFDNKRYRIINKLGFGAYSTVWLARDAEDQKNVSLKFMRADISEETSRELDVQKQLDQQKKQNTGGRRFILSHLRAFIHHGPNGDHQCLVSEVVGPTILDAKCAWNNEELPIPVAKRFTAQLAQATAELHSAGIIHGDISPKNVAIKILGIDEWSLGQIKKLGEPSKCQIKRKDGEQPGPHAPDYAIYPLNFTRLGQSYLSAEIRIIDFGEATFGSRRVEKLRTHPAYRAPEAYFERKVDSPADIWAFACTSFELFEELEQNPLIYAYTLNPRWEKDLYLYEMVSILGKFPKQWWEKWAKRLDYFNNSGVRSKECEEELSPPLTERIRNMRRSDRLKSKDMEELEALLRMCLEHNFRSRASGKQAWEYCRGKRWDRQ